MMLGTGSVPSSPGSGSLGLPVSGGARTWIVAAAALVVAWQAARWIDDGAATGPVAAAAAVPAVAFVEQGAGTVVDEARLYSQPGGGTVLARLAEGTAVAIGGRISVPAGLAARDVLWVRVGGAGGGDGARYGFVAARGVAQVAGAPLRLALRGVPAMALLRPDEAVRYAPQAAGPATAATASAGAMGAAVTYSAEPAPASPDTPDADGEVAAVAAPTSGATPPSADVAVPWLPATIEAWRPQILAAARTHGFDPELVALVMLVESGGNPRAHSPSGAVGLMQVMPSTGAGIAAERGIAGYTGDKLWEPETNIDFGAYYLAQQLRSFGRADDADWQQSVELAASAYNGGPGSVQRLLAGGALPNETVRYRRWVGGMWRERHAAASETFAAWMGAGGSVLVAAAERELATR